MQPNITTDILLVTSTDIEARAIRDVFEVRSHAILIESKLYDDLGSKNGVRLLHDQLARMGAGQPGGAQDSIKSMLETARPSAVVMVGVAAGLKQQPIGTVLVADSLAFYEAQRVGPAGIIPRGSRVSSSSILLGRFRRGIYFKADTAVEFGLVLSGDKLIDNTGLADSLRQQWEEAIGVEMEGEGLYSAAHEHTYWGMVKAVCDHADGNKDVDKSSRQSTAARNAAEFIHYLWETGGFTGIPRPRTHTTSTTTTTSGNAGGGSSSIAIVASLVILALVVLALVVLAPYLRPRESTLFSAVATQSPQSPAVVDVALTSTSPIAPTVTEAPTVAPTVTEAPTIAPTPSAAPVLAANCQPQLTASGSTYSILPAYDPSGYMGDIDDITDVQKQEDGVRFVYTPTGKGHHEWEYKYSAPDKPAKFAGLMFLRGPNNFGDQGGGDLSKTRGVIRWEARVVSSWDTNAQVAVEFVAGGVTWRLDDAKKEKVPVTCPDSLHRIPLGLRTLTTQWQSFEKSLAEVKPEQLRNVIGAFGFTIPWPPENDPANPPKIVIEVRNIRYEER